MRIKNKPTVKKEKEGKWITCEQCTTATFVPIGMTDVTIRCSCGNVYRGSHEKKESQTA